MPTAESHEYPLFPGCDCYSYQSVGFAIEVADSAEIRRAFQFAFQRIRPAVIRATHLIRASCGFSHHRRGVMATDVEEAAQRSVVAAHDNDRFAGDFGRDEI